MNPLWNVRAHTPSVALYPQILNRNDCPSAAKDTLSRAQSTDTVALDDLHRLSIQRDLAIALRTTSNQEEALQQMMHAVMQIEGIDGAGMYLVDLQTGDLQLVMHHGWSAQLVATIAAYTYTAWQADLIQHNLSSSDTYSVSLQPIPEKLRNEGVLTLEVFPIQDQKGQIRAVLQIASRTYQLFPTMTRLMLETIAAQVGNVFARIADQQMISTRHLQESLARLHVLEHNLQRQIQRLATLRQIDMTIISHLDLRATLTMVVDLIRTSLEVDAVGIRLFNPSTQAFDYIAGQGFRTILPHETHLCLAVDCAACTLLQCQSRCVPDTHQCPNCSLRSTFLQAEGFNVCYSIPLLIKGDVKGVLEVFHRTPLVPDAEWVTFLHTLAGQVMIVLATRELLHELHDTTQKLEIAYDATIAGWARALELRDAETEGHSQRVTTMTLKLAQAIGLPNDELVHIRRGALLHDIGKMAVPDHILQKPGVLSAEEQMIIREHPVTAYHLLSPIPFLQPALDIPYYHHEKWDGTGYPHGLKGEAIPLAARLFAVVDVWDALRSDRPYRRGWTTADVRTYIQSQAGTHFDPHVVDVFLALLEHEEATQACVIEQTLVT